MIICVDNSLLHSKMIFTLSPPLPFKSFSYPCVFCTVTSPPLSSHPVPQPHSVKHHLKDTFLDLSTLLSFPPGTENARPWRLRAKPLLFSFQSGLRASLVILLNKAVLINQSDPFLSKDTRRLHLSFFFYTPPADFILYLWLWVCTCHVCMGAHRGQKRMSDSLMLELCVIMNHLM